MRTFWLSFADPDKGHLGCCVVDLTHEEIQAAKERIDVLFPDAKDGAEDVFAATWKAKQQGINPGGEVLCQELRAPGYSVDWLKKLPRNRLMSKQEAAAFSDKQVS